MEETLEDIKGLISRHKLKDSQYNGHQNKDIRVITKLPNSEQSYKGKVKTHKYINRQNQSTAGKLKTVKQHEDHLI